MTHLTKTRPFGLMMTAAVAALAAGAVQAQVQEWPRTVPLCQLEEEWPLTQRLADRLFAREDFDMLLRYASQNCPNVALLLTDGATAAIPGSAAPAPAAPATGPEDDLRRVPLCRLEEEMPLPRGVAARILAREDFDELLRYSSENCPEVALLLTDLPTATIPETGGIEDDPDVDREDPSDRRRDDTSGGDDDPAPEPEPPTEPEEPTDPEPPTEPETPTDPDLGDDSVSGGDDEPVNFDPPDSLDDFLNRYN